MELRPYIGIPFRDRGCGFDGCDCYGLARLVCREELGVDMPALEGAYSTAYARSEVDGVVRGALAGGWARDVTDEPRRPGDVLVFRRGGEDAHVGLWAGPGLMLHVIEGVDSCLERYDGVRWRRMLHRVLRHAALD